MRLRVALHAGEVDADSVGYGGESIVTVMRLIDSDELRAVLRTAPNDLAVIVSEQLHRDVVMHQYRGIDPADYREVHVSRKKFSQPAWIRVPGMSAGPWQTGGERGQLSSQPARTRPLGGVSGNSTPEPAAVTPGGVHFGAAATFSGPTSIGGHAAGRDVNIQDGGSNV
ncbi:MAG TPA: hypothetical protein VGS19_30345 [Streptosporangiaceae bacterium]|nr:hypothetical protein [Streptosporangiaceae bacterium]